MLTTPLGWSFVLGIAGGGVRILGRRRRGALRCGAWLVAGAWLAAMVAAWPPAASVVSRPLERWATRWPQVPAWAESASPEAIVVFAGGIEGAKVPGAPLDTGSLERVVEAVRQARRWPRALVIFSGGTKHPAPGGITGGRRMAEVAQELGLEPERIVVEASSRDTYENAIYCAEILRSRAITRVALVTSAVHMARSRAALLKQGYPSLPLPVSAPRLGPAGLGWLTPDDGAVRRMTWAFHEWLGLAWYRLRGRI